MNHIQASLGKLTASGEIDSDDRRCKDLEAVRGGTSYCPSTFPTVMLQTWKNGTKQCTVPLCACQCHVVSKYQHPRWIASHLGSLCIEYSGLPYLSTAKCNESRCTKGEDAVIKATYYFPKWAPYFPRMFSFLGRWTKFNGPAICLKMPRVVPSSSEVFVLAQKGNVQDIKLLFSLSKASIHDVSVGEGRSVMHVSHCNLG